MITPMSMYTKPCASLCAHATLLVISIKITQYRNLSQKANHIGKVWPFVAGMLHKMNKQHQPFFWYILLDYPWDLTGQCHIPLLINCLEESKVNDNVNIPSKDKMLSFLEKCFKRIFVKDCTFALCIQSTATLKRK